jgi:hypothetical protein
VGGFEAYLLADEEESAAAAVYRARDDDGGVINVPPAANSLNLLLRDAGLMRFVKFVGAGRCGSRGAGEGCLQAGCVEHGVPIPDRGHVAMWGSGQWGGVPASSSVVGQSSSASMCCGCRGYGAPTVASLWLQGLIAPCCLLYGCAMHAL